MKGIANIVGILLIILGAIVLVYQGFTYNKSENILQIGNLKVTADQQKRVYLPPVLGGLSVVAGIILIVVTQRRS